MTYFPNRNSHRTNRFQIRYEAVFAMDLIPPTNSTADHWIRVQRQIGWMLFVCFAIWENRKSLINTSICQCSTYNAIIIIGVCFVFVSMMYVLYRYIEENWIFTTSITFIHSSIYLFPFPSFPHCVINRNNLFRCFREQRRSGLIFISLFIQFD